MCNVLIGGAIGDALGVPFETMFTNNPLLLSWDNKSFLGSQHHGLKPAQYSDDTQMSIMVAESLIDNQGFDPKDLSERYVNWITSNTARGYGKTTLMAVNNLINGKSWTESGIAGSVGNGTAMRAAPFGIFFRRDLKLLKDVVKTDSAITHASEEAEAGALAIALTVAYAVNNDITELLDKLTPQLPESKVRKSLYGLSALLTDAINPQQALSAIGTKADVRQTVPAALYCFLKFNNYSEAVISAIRAGGDTDTTAAIVGALFGAHTGFDGIQSNWISQIEDKEKLIILDSKLFRNSIKV